MRIPGSWDARAFLDGLPTLSRLSDDILVDHIFVHLMVEDILALRQVSKLYYALSHQGVIWKRFLRLLGPYAPFRPPSSAFSLGRVSAFEAERLVTRALTLEQQWNSFRARYTSWYEYPIHHNILSMVVLPGGKHMVASTCNADRTQHSLIVYCLDHRTSGIAHTAELPVRSEARNVCAKYMTVNCALGLVISYTTRRTRSTQEDPASVHESAYAPRRDSFGELLDPSEPFDTCTTVMLPLDSLDTLSHPDLVPGSSDYQQLTASLPPPHILTKIRSSAQLGFTDLVEIDGIPCISVCKQPYTIVFRALCGEKRMTSFRCLMDLEMLGGALPRIHTFRILPEQREILVARMSQTAASTPYQDSPPTVDEPLGSITLEMFSIPARIDCDEVCFKPTTTVRYNGIGFEDVQISDPTPSARFSGLWPPIHVFYRHSHGAQLTYICLPPIKPTELLQPGVPRYHLPNHAITGSENGLTREDRVFRAGPRICPYECRAFALPGAHRSLVYTTPLSNSMTTTPPLEHVYSFTTRDSVNDAFSQSRRNVISRVRRNLGPGPPTREEVAMIFRLPTQLRCKLRKAMQAMAWDESTGRVLFACPDQPILHIMDVSVAPSEDIAGQLPPLPLPEDLMQE